MAARPVLGVQPFVPLPPRGQTIDAVLDTTGAASAPAAPTAIAQLPLPPAPAAQDPVNPDQITKLIGDIIKDLTTLTETPPATAEEKKKLITNIITNLRALNDELAKPPASGGGKKKKAMRGGAAELSAAIFNISGLIDKAADITTVSPQISAMSKYPPPSMAGIAPGQNALDPSADFPDAVSNLIVPRMGYAGGASKKSKKSDIKPKRKH